MTKDKALTLALDFIERVNKDGWLLADFEPEMYVAITAIKEALAQIEVGCAECGVNSNHALYCVACAEKFIGESCASLDVAICTPNRDYADMSAKEIYEEALIDGTLSFRAAIRKEKNIAIPQQRKWVGLTYEEETELIRLAHNHAGIRFYIQAAEARLKEKNK